ncbi:MAG: serine/threonine protein phosphatase [Deltaproteobacteria bacterium]|nr:serine/threonine protein phosphatase [Deltaproteobacteria bacterium]MBW2413424.1 serine/threonine protein phosphatase [Deltaproteobacteria bacterium]
MIYAIGDIHGMRAELEELLEQLPLTDDDQLVFIGDYVDRGPDAKGVVDVLIELSHRHDCTFLIGNHEAMFLSFLGWDDPWYFGAEAFLQNGGDTTLQSYGYFEDCENFALPPDHDKFYRDLVPYHVKGEYVFVHAGLSRDSLSLSDIEYALEHEAPRDILWQRSTSELPHSLGATVIYGHTPVPDLQVRWNLPYTIGIDTGCVYGGSLTAIRLPDETLFQVECKSPEYTFG